MEKKDLAKSVWTINPRNVRPLVKFLYVFQLSTAPSFTMWRNILVILSTHKA